MDKKKEEEEKKENVLSRKDKRGCNVILFCEEERSGETEYLCKRI